MLIYDSLSRISKEEYSNGVYVVYSYDSCGRVISKTICNSKDHLIDSYEYSFGKNGELTGIIETDSNGNEITTEYSYNSVGFLLSEKISSDNGTLKQVYDYDYAGNRISKETIVSGDISSFVTENIEIGKTIYVYNEINQLVKEQIGDKENNYTYDGNGNLIKISGSKNVEYVYNTRNQLIHAKIFENGLAKEETYEYDVEGVRKTKKTGDLETDYVTYSINGISYLWASKEGGIVNKFYQRAFGIVSERAEETNYFYLTDALGNVRGLTDNIGNITDSYRFDGYGVLLSRSGNTENCYGYQSEEVDEATGLIYLRARYYSSDCGRFISQDSYSGNVWNPVTLNRYAYAINSPTNYNDPSGHIVSMISCMVSLSLQSINDNSEIIHVNGLLGALIGVADTALGGGDSDAITKAAVVGYGVGIASGVLFSLGEVFATVKLITMIFSLETTIAGFYFAGVSLGEGNYAQATERYLLSLYSLSAWCSAYEEGVMGEIAEAAGEEINNYMNAARNKVSNLLKGIFKGKSKTFMAGKEGEEELARLVGGDSQQYKKTSLGRRFIDQLSPDNIAHESKVGYTTLTQRVKTQILKDAELIKTEEINGAHWHFFTSGVTGKGGASQQLLDF